MRLLDNSAEQQGRAILARIAGNVMEWYDFTVYGYFAAVIGRQFFPAEDPISSLLAAFGVFAAGFLMRPFGSLVFGHIGDKIGRKAALMASVILMAVSTFLIGLLPTYQQIGITAPVLLVLLRLLQGIGIGGEWGGAVLMVVENAQDRNRGLLGSMVQIGWPVGNLAAIGIFAALSQVPESDFLLWAWRIPFLISIVLVGIGLYIRMQLDETPVFREIAAKNEVARLPLIEILTQHRRSFFTAIGLKVSEISYAIIAGVFSISYVTGKLAMPRSVIINAIFLSAVVAL